jgi:type I restriction enzyme R subunit
LSEADTCREYVVPKLQAAGWDDNPRSIAEQRVITDGRIVPVGSSFVRRPPKRVDYLLHYTNDLPIAVVEAKADYKSAYDGVQQAKQYAEMLGLYFAFATNGREIVEVDYVTGLEVRRDDFPSPAELWVRYRSARGLPEGDDATLVLAPANHLVGQGERYYQQLAIRRVMEALSLGQRRILLTMATGTGKTAVAFQICWKLWNARWNNAGEHRRPKVLYLADRNILVDQPKDGIFAVFGDARTKIGDGEVVQSRDIYFSSYQAMAEDERRSGLFRAFTPGFFDLIIVDECHRGSARDDSAWRDILQYFSPAVQLGLTATPLRDESRDTYSYFGNPVYEYSLRQGIDDGFLAPYRVHRIITEWDAAGWRPTKDERDRFGRPIPDEEYQTKDFERAIALRARTEAIAAHFSRFLKNTDRHAKTIVFCVDQEHASEMRHALSNLNADLVVHNPDYVCRVTSDEGDIGRGHLSRFQDVDTSTPTILTTSQLLTTGVDAPTCKNIVLARVIGSMSEFKQIIGRGTRVRDDYDKLWFNIIDYTGSATRLFADPAFDGDPIQVTEEELRGPNARNDLLETGVTNGTEQAVHADEARLVQSRRKLYVDGGHVEIAAQLVYELDSDGKRLRVVRLTDYAAERVRALWADASDLRSRWVDASSRSEVIRRLEERGIGLAALSEAAQMPDADPFDLLCHLAFNAPLRTRRERAQRLRAEGGVFFDRYGPVAREILDELLEKYARHGSTQFTLPDVLRIPPLSSHGSVMQIAAEFGGPENLRIAVQALQNLLYAR